MEIRGKYKIINKIGAGQFGTIFKAMIIMAGLLRFQNIKSKILQLGAIQCPDDECLFRYEFEGDIIDITNGKFYWEN